MVKLSFVCLHWTVGKLKSLSLLIISDKFAMFKELELKYHYRRVDFFVTKIEISLKLPDGLLMIAESWDR